MLEAKVFFTDGSVENVLYHTYDRYLKNIHEHTCKNFKFTTNSGLYLFEEYVDCTSPVYTPTKLYKPPIMFKNHNFSKWDEYELEWKLTDEISKIEFYDKEVENNAQT